MVRVEGPSILDCFASLECPRIEGSRRHKLLDIIAIAICATICGADSWVHIEMFGRSKEEWFRTFLELPGGIPCHDTFGEVFSRLDPEQFQSCFMDWIQQVAQVAQGEVVAIDGKRRRANIGASRIHLPKTWRPFARFPTTCSRRTPASKPVSKASASTPAGGRTTFSKSCLLKMRLPWVARTGLHSGRIG